MTATSGPLDFLSPVSHIQGFGPRRVSALQESGISTVGDLLYFFPRNYLDRSKTIPIGEAGRHLNTTCSFTGTVSRVRVERGRRGRFLALLQDESGEIELVWFGKPFLYQSLFEAGEKIVVTGKVNKHLRLQMAHPVVDRISDDGAQPLSAIPIYSLTEPMREAGINRRLLGKAIRWAIEAIGQFPQVLPDAVEKKHDFPPLKQCLLEIHSPADPKLLDRYKDRLRYEELFNLALTLRWSRRKFALPGRSLDPGDLPARFAKILPFTLTDEQRSAIATLYDDARSDHRMHRLLQGDVGCGKTVVAFHACFPALASSLQVAWLAPTEILAMQTYKKMSEWLGALGFKAELLLGATVAREKKRIGEGLADGSIKFVIGTHALLQPSVRFQKLGMIVIDEQHKFGAAQRLKLQEKDPASDFLLMSATPIPQTLAKTLYGDLDIVTIAKGPAGRSPVSTHLVPEAKRKEMESFIHAEVGKNGASAYYVVPRIEQEDAEGSRDVSSAFEKLTHGTFRDIPVSTIHGRMSSEEKEQAMESFAAGRIKLLISTTVIEVGIDVPEARIMVIENAEFFGLAQLHQLRGRVGRGAGKSYCFLFTSPEADPEAVDRLAYFCRHHDGFKIAEKDLDLRGPGEIAGFRQTGWEDLKIADIIRDAGLFREIQEELAAMAAGRK